MARPRPDLTHRIAVIDPAYESREMIRALLSHESRVCIAVSNPTDIMAMSARARRFTWVYFTCAGAPEVLADQIVRLQRAIGARVPMLLAVPSANADAARSLLSPKDALIPLPCVGLQLAARLADFTRAHQPPGRPRRAAKPDADGAKDAPPQPTDPWWR